MSTESMVTQADIARAEEWSSLLNHRYSEYEGDAVADLAADFAAHRTAAQPEREAVLEEALQKIAAPIGNEPLPGDHDYSSGKQVEFWRKLAIDYRRTAIRALKTTPAPVSTDEIVAALEPFAREGKGLTPALDIYSWRNTGMSNADFRRAHAILSRIRGEGE